MRDEYDFSKKKRKIFGEKKEIKISMSIPTYEYFEKLADEKGIDCERLMGFYLADCAYKGYKLKGL